MSHYTAMSASRSNAAASPDIGTSSVVSPTSTQPWLPLTSTEQPANATVLLPADTKMREDAIAQRKLMISAVAVFLFMVGEFVGGKLSNSLAIYTDAAHMLSDFFSFIICLVALRLSSHPPSAVHNTGYHRMEVLGSIVSTLIIWVMVGLLLHEAVTRGLDLYHDKSPDIDGFIMFLTAGVGLILNVSLMFVLGHSHSHGGGGGHSHSHGGGGGHASVNCDESLRTVPSPGSKVAPCEYIDEEADCGACEKKCEAVPLLRNPPKRVSSRCVNDHSENVCHSDNLVIPQPQGGPSMPSLSVGMAVLSSSTVGNPAPRKASRSPRSPGRPPSATFDTSADVNSAAQETSHQSPMAVRAAALHVLGDMIQSIGVLIAGALIWWGEHYYKLKTPVAPPHANVSAPLDAWHDASLSDFEGFGNTTTSGHPTVAWVYWLDPACTVLFSILVLLTTFPLLRESISILLERAPSGVDVLSLGKELLAVPGVRSVHGLHVWAYSALEIVVSAHLVVDCEEGLVDSRDDIVDGDLDSLGSPAATRSERSPFLKSTTTVPTVAVLADAHAVVVRHGVRHATFQIEPANQ